MCIRYTVAVLARVIWPVDHTSWGGLGTLIYTTHTRHTNVLLQMNRLVWSYVFTDKQNFAGTGRAQDLG